MTLEGAIAVHAALLARRRRMQVVLVRRDTPTPKIQEILNAAEAAGVPVNFVEREQLDKMAHGVTHGGVIAVVEPIPRLDAAGLLEIIAPRTNPLLLLLEGVDDARNLGFVIRSADSLGVDAVLIKKHIWDLDETEISRAASGAIDRLPLAQVDDVEIIRQLQKRGLQCLGCIAGVKRSVFRTDLTGPTLLALGGEKRGLSGATRELCDRFITIPTTGGASSLSLSHAAAIVMGEAFRQRLLSGELEST